MQRIRTKLILGLLVMGFGTALLWAASESAGSRPSEAEVDAYIKLHQQILDTLSESFKQPHPYVSSRAEKSAKFSWPVELQKHEKHLLLTAQYDGQQKKKYVIQLALKPDALPETNNISSDSMQATVLLNHYLRPLERLGLANPSSPLAAISAVQYAAGEWVPKEQFTSEVRTDSPAWVEGEVFVSPKDSQAVIRVTVGGRFVRR